MIKKTLLFFMIFGVYLCAQSLSSVTFTVKNKSLNIPAYNFQGTVYISVEKIADALGLEYAVSDTFQKVEIEFADYVMTFTSRNPFVLIDPRSTGESFSHQLKKSSHLMDNMIFVPMEEGADLFSLGFGKAILILSPNKLFLADEMLMINSVSSIELSESNNETYLTVKTENRVNARLEIEEEGLFTLKVKNCTAIVKEYSELKPEGMLEDVVIVNNHGDVEIHLKTISKNITAEILNTGDRNTVTIHFFEREVSDWFERESEHFKIIYRENHAYLVNQILSDAESALKSLMMLFDYESDEKIIINTYDVSDYGFGATTTVPQNFIRLEIESLEPGYEILPYNDRFRWLLSHELVHIVVNDHAKGVESFLRDIFGKTPPEKTQPITVFYSLLTNFKRYTPRWYQESFAVFVETWFSGGYGRVLGSFDEMYFRSMVGEGNEFPAQQKIETIESHNSILLETLHYIYGARFVSYLSILYGSDNVLKWFRAEPGDSYQGFESKFQEVFSEDFDDVWQDFILYEKEFQNKNISTLRKSETTKLKKIGTQTFGWITNPQFDRHTGKIIFGYHRSHQLASIQSLDLHSGLSEDIASLPTPSMIQVASTAFDQSSGLFFYTTNNNQLFRDIWALDVQSGEKKLLLENCRIGDLSVSPVTRDLWGVKAQSGIKSLVVIPYPYHSITDIVDFDSGDDLFELEVNVNGDKLAGVLHKSNGVQSIVIIDLKSLLQNKEIKFQNVSSTGSPENPSWSEDGKFLYWNAFTNGVSNIYRYDFYNSKIEAISNCPIGLVKPLEISSDTLLAFEYSTDGFTPVILESKPSGHLPAIEYMGQQVLTKNPQLAEWILPYSYEVSNPFTYSKEKPYNSFSNLNIHSFVPVVSGFQKQVVFGLFTHIGDPLLTHDLILEVGVSPLKESPNHPDFHLKFKYDYKQLLFLEVSYNGPEFFDLFNDRKRGMIGQSYKLGHTYYWKYDSPLKVKQASTFTFYRGVEFINDNLVPVSQPDFSVLATNLNSKNLRRSIGSSDYEYGTNFDYTLTLYGTNFDSLEYALNMYAEFSDFSTWIFDHNVFHVKFAGGYLWDNEQLVQARFYIGGFGNRGFDNDEIKQFRRVFRFPGIPIYSLMTDRFGKILIENAFPPLRFGNLEFASQLLNHLDFSVYSQGLITRSEFGDYWVDVGAQMDLKFKHWYNLESTLSAGIAKAWSDKISDWEWFISFKLLKD